MGTGLVTIVPTLAGTGAKAGLVSSMRFAGIIVLLPRSAAGGIVVADCVLMTEPFGPLVFTPAGVPGE
jgi:hypothetical protein